MKVQTGANTVDCVEGHVCVCARAKTAAAVVRVTWGKDFNFEMGCNTDDS